MAVTREFVDYALGQMGRVLPVTGRRMFGGFGIYSEGVFFALIADDSVYLKVDDSNRRDFEGVGAGPFRPFGEAGPTMQYYELPGELLEEPTALLPWLESALQVARRAGKRSTRK